MLVYYFLMFASTRVPHLFAATAAGLSLGLASLVPNPAQSVEACPIVKADTEWDTSVKDPESLRVAQLAAAAAGFMIGECRTPGPNKEVVVRRLGDGAVFMSVVRQTKTTVPGGTDGTYQMEATLQEDSSGVLSGVKRVGLLEGATVAGAVFKSLEAQFTRADAGSWDINVQMATRMHAGGAVVGNTEQDINKFDVDQLKNVVGSFLNRQHNNVPTGLQQTKQQWPGTFSLYPQN